MKVICAFFLSLSVGLSSAQFFYHQNSAYNIPQQHLSLSPPAPAYHNNQYAHQSVIENSLREAELPPELKKSDRFYKNPRIAAALAKESWFTDQEMPVHNREAEKIPRGMVYKLFKNAGYIERR